MQPVTRIVPSVPPTLACSGLGRSDPTQTPTAEPVGRAIACLPSAPAASTDPIRQRPSAAFLAQLIATAQQAPQTRQRRRAEPQEANAVYAAVATPATWTGRAIYRAT